MAERGHTYKDEILEKLKSPDIKMGELLEIKNVAGEHWRLYNGKDPITAQILTEKASGDVGGFPATPTEMNFPALDEAYVAGAFKGLFYSEALPGYVGKKMFLYGGTTKGTSYWDYHFNLIDLDNITTPVYSFKAQTGLSASKIEINDVIGAFYSDYSKQIFMSYQVTYSGVKRYGFQWCKITDGTTGGGYAGADVSPHPNAVFSLYQAPNDITSLYMAAYDVDNKKLYLRKYLNFNSMSSISTFAKDLHDFTKYDRTYDLELLADSKPILFWDNTNSKIMVQWQVADGTTYIGDFADPITTQVQLGNTTNTLKNTSMYTSQEGKSSLLMLGGKLYDFSKVGLPTGVTALPNNIEWMGGRNYTSGKLRLWFFNQSDSKYYNMSYNATLNKIEYISNVGFSDAGPEMTDPYPGLSKNHIRRMTKPIFLGSKDGKELWVFNMRLAIYRYETSLNSFHRVYSVLVCIDSSNGNILWSWGNEGNIHYKHGDFDWDVLAFNTWGLTDMREDPTDPSTVPSPLGGTGTFSFVVRGSQEIEEIKDKILFFFHDMGSYFSGLYSKRPLAYGFCWKNFDEVIACTSKADLLTLLSTGGMPIFSTTIDNVPSIEKSDGVYAWPSVVWDCPFIRTSTGDIHLDYFTQGSSIMWNVFHFNIQLTNLNSSSLLFEYFNTYNALNENSPQSIMGFTKNPSGLLNGFFDFGNTQFPFDKVLMYAGVQVQMSLGSLAERLQSDTFWSYKLKRDTYMDDSSNKSTILVYKSHICTTSDLMYVVCYLTNYIASSNYYPTKRYCRVNKYYHNGADWQTLQTFHFSLEDFSSFLKLTEIGSGETMVAVNVTDFTALYFCVAQDNSLYVLKTGVPDGTLKSAIGCDLQSPTTFYSQPLNIPVLPLASYPTPQGIMLIDYKGTVSKVLIDIMGDTYQEYTFIPYPFIRESIKSEKDNLARTIKLGIPETTENHLMSIVNSGEEMRTKEVNIYRVFLDDDDKPVGPAVNLFSGHIESWEYIADKKAATLKLSHDMFSFKQPCPRHAFTMRCRHRFKGVRCGYSGAEAHCDKSLTRCQTLGNEARFGGFPWVAMRQRRVLWR